MLQLLHSQISYKMCQMLHMAPTAFWVICKDLKCEEITSCTRPYKLGNHSISNNLTYKTQVIVAMVTELYGPLPTGRCCLSLV